MQSAGHTFSIIHDIWFVEMKGHWKKNSDMSRVSTKSNSYLKLLPVSKKIRWSNYTLPLVWYLLWDCKAIRVGHCHCLIYRFIYRVHIIRNEKGPKMVFLSVLYSLDRWNDHIYYLCSIGDVEDVRKPDYQLVSDYHTSLSHCDCRLSIAYTYTSYVKYTYLHSMSMECYVEEFTWYPFSSNRLGLATMLGWSLWSLSWRSCKSNDGRIPYSQG